MIEHLNRVARFVVGRTPINDADAHVVLAHVNHPKLPVGRIRRRVLQNIVNIGLRDVEGNRRRLTVLSERDLECEQNEEDTQDAFRHDLPP